MHRPVTSTKFYLVLLGLLAGFLAARAWGDETLGIVSWLFLVAAGVMLVVQKGAAALRRPDGTLTEREMVMAVLADLYTNRFPSMSASIYLQSYFEELSRERSDLGGTWAVESLVRELREQELVEEREHDVLRCKTLHPTIKGFRYAAARLLPIEGDLQEASLTVNEYQADNRRIYMGDHIHDVGEEAVLVNRSTVVDSLNRVSTLGAEEAAALKDLFEAAEESGNAEAAENVKALAEELELHEPRPARVRAWLSGIGSALPDVAKVASALEKLGSSFGSSAG